MKLMRKIGGVLLAGAMVLSLGACSTSDTSWILKDGEYQLPAGVYLYNLMQNYYMAHYMVEDMSKDVLSQSIQEKDEDGNVTSESKAADWIQEKAMDTTKRDLAVLKKFDELGLALTEEQQGIAKTQVESSWEQNQETFEKNGIAKSTAILLNELSMKDQEIFNALYQEGGTQEVKEADLKKEYDSNYIKAGMLTFRLPTKTEPAEDASEEDKKAAEESYNTSLTEAKKQADDWYVQAQAAAGAKKDFNDIINLYNKGQSSDPDAYDMTRNNYQLINTSTSTMDETVLEELKKAEIGVPVKIETDTQIVVAVRKDINEDPADFEGVKDTILHSLKDTEYSDLMKELQNAQSVQVNDASVKRYTVKKIKLQ